MNIKEQLYLKCEESIEKRLKVIQRSISDLEKALHSETKSSVGDKHETGRAMVQLEREKVGQQLAEIQKSQEALLKINTITVHNKVALGSVVYTSKLNYYISISSGEISINDTCFYGISPATPIAKVLLGREKEDIITFRNSTFVIIKVL